MKRYDEHLMRLQRKSQCEDRAIVGIKRECFHISIEYFNVYDNGEIGNGNLMPHV